MTLALVMLGAALGAPARWLVDRAVSDRHHSVFPWGTFTVNVVGSLALGFVLGAGSSQAWYAVVGTGFLGGFTTFSTFSYETHRLIAEGSRLISGANVAASLLAGLLAAFAGWHLAEAVTT